MSRSLLIECKDYIQCRQILSNLDKLRLIICNMNLENLKIYVNKILYGKFQVNKTNHTRKYQIELDLNKYQEFLKTVWESDKYMTITKLEDGVVLACTPKLQADGTIRPTGVGRDTKRVWIPEDWEYRNTILQKDGIINCYEYEGYVKSEVDDPNISSPKVYPLALDSELIEYFGEQCILSTFTYL